MVRASSSLSSTATWRQDYRHYHKAQELSGGEGRAAANDGGDHHGGDREACSRWSQPEIKPALVKTYNDQAGEIKNWRTKWTDQAQLYEEKQQRMMQLRTIMVGQTPLLKLKQVPEKIGRGGTVGKLVEWLAAMRTWIEEEMDSTRGGEDIVIDRLTFAASVRIANPTNLVIAHSCDLCVAGHSTLIAAP